MDKDLMALMGIEDDRPFDAGLATQPLDRSQSQEPSDFFEPTSDSDTDLPPVHSKTTYLLDRQSQPLSECRPSPPSSPPLAPRASTSALFAPSRWPRSPSPQRLKAVSSSLFSLGLNPSKVKVAKSPKKNKGGGNDLLMFSPTLSPRKPKRSTSSLSLSSPAPKSSSMRSPAITVPFHGKDVRTTSLSPDLTPTLGRRRGPASPLSSYELQKQTLAFSDNDSDISSLEDNCNNSAPLSRSQNVSLWASFTLGANMDMKLDSASDDELPTVDAAIKETPAVSRLWSQDGGKNIEVHRNANDDRDLEDIMSSHVGAFKEIKKSKAAIQKEQMQMQMEKERLMRSSTFKVDQRFKKQTLSTLLESAQSKLKGQPIISQSVLSGPNVPSTPLKKPLPRTIALDDSSEDETEQDAERREEEAQWKLSATKALLLSSIPKKERGMISRELKAGAGPVSIDRRLELERTLQMSPLSSKIQSMSLNNPSAILSPSSSSTSTKVSPPPKPDFSSSLSMRLTSPQKSQRTDTVTNIHQFNLQMERQLAKTHLMRRKKLEDEAKKSGTWRSPEEHAAEQLRIEEKRSQGLDPDEEDDHEEDGDYNPGDEIVEEGDSEMDRGSSNELGSEELDNDIEGNDIGRLEASGQDSEDEVAVGDEDEVRGGEDDDEDEEDGEDDEDKDTDEDEEERVALVKKNRRNTVIGDDEDLKVVIVDRSRTIAESESDDQDGVSGADEIGSGSDVGEDDDVSDIEQDMVGVEGTQGFGAFFESSYDPNKSKKARAMPTLGRAPTSMTDSSLSPIVSSDPSQLQASYGNTQGSIDGALDFLSGKFPTQTQHGRSSFIVSAASESQVPSTLESQDSAEFKSQIPASMEPRFFDDDNLNETTSDSVLPRPRSAFEVMSMAMNQESGLRRLHKREAKPKREKTEKSAFIEYEAEEEEDEYMGMGGIDYESDVDQDDYDLGDGMVDTTVVIDSQDVENVKQLHMKHEQDQHDKEISDLVHGIAAGNLWKRRNGQIDDLDLFDEEDMNGRFRRKKKLKVSEKFEKLADNPNTAAFARAFKKNMDDDQLVFLSDADESAEEDESPKDDQGGPSSAAKDRQHQMSEDAESSEEDAELSEEDDEGESLNMDKRQARLQKARLIRDESDQSFYGSMDPNAITAMTKGQILPFDVSPDDWLTEDSQAFETLSTSTPVRTTSKATDSLTHETPASQVDIIDEYKDVMRRTKVIRDILDGVDEVAEDGAMTSPSCTKSAMFGLLDRIVDRTSLSDSSTVRSSVDAPSGFVQSSSHNDVDVSAFVRPRMLARQNSSFLSEDRRNQFLSTVGEDSRGGNASTRVVKEVNRRKMAFATSKKLTSTGSFSTSSSAAAATITSSTKTITTTTATSVTRTTKIASLKTAGVQRAPSASGPGRLLQILSLEGEE
ncbi:hypothetical protein BGZ47_004140 [Haplosporangium gracile]|nr:hypothetical protein BGZ47_004140 [Haplosporangium gracile]